MTLNQIANRSITRLAAIAVVLTGGVIAGEALAKSDLASDAADASGSNTPVAGSEKAFFGKDPSKCPDLQGRPDVRIRIRDVRSDEGNLRVSLYNDVAEDFLVNKKYIARIDVPAQEGEVDLCVSVPHPGVYALGVLHDVNKNGKFTLISDGGGFSQNPSITFGAPSHDKAAFTVPPEGKEIKVEVKYPIASHRAPTRRRRH